MTDLGYHFYIPLVAGDRLWITANQRLFWADRSRRTRAWRDYACDEARRRNLPMLPLARVVCELHFADNRRRDPANWSPTAKACIDGLVDAGLFADDDHKHVIGPDMRIGDVVGKQHRGLDIRIYPIGASHESARGNRRPMRRLRSHVPKATTARVDGDGVPGRAEAVRADPPPGVPGRVETEAEGGGPR